MRKLLALALAASTSAAVAAQPSTTSPPAQPPRLVVAISVDQLTSALLEEYRPQLRGGLARLANGTNFRNGFQAHAATETCPGHSTILTGTHPARNGIIANSWWNMQLERSDKRVYCAEDVSAPGKTSRDYAVSPANLKVPTLGDLLKSRTPQSLNVAVAGKDRSAVMMSGRRVDQRWFWDGKRFATDLQVRTPGSAAAVNAAVARTIATPRPPLDPPPFCAGKAQAIALESRTVGTGRFAREAGDTAAFRASPESDGATLALAAGLVQELGLGRDQFPDILSIGLSATDVIGHTYGNGGQETCLQMFSLDRDLGDFFRLLDGQGIDYAVVLTSDHGVMDVPERLRAKGVSQANWVDKALDAEVLGRSIAQKLRLSGTALVGDFAGDIYVASSVPARAKPVVLREALAFYRQHPQVEIVFSREELSRLPIPTGSPDRWTTAERVRASFDPERSGDLVVVLKPFVQPLESGRSRGAVASHGSAWDYDRRVPILFWRRGMAPTIRQEAVATVDIMPTLAAQLGLQIPHVIDGKCLPAVPGISCNAR